MRVARSLYNWSAVVDAVAAVAADVSSAVAVVNAKPLAVAPYARAVAWTRRWSRWQ